MHHSPATRIEGVPSVHGAAIVPQYEIADAPNVLPRKLRSIDEAPELVEQRLGLRKLKPHQIGVAAAPEIEHATADVRMRADQRMHRAWRGARVVGRRYTLAHVAPTVVGAVVLDLEASDAVLERLRQCLIDAVHRAERCVASNRRHFERIENTRLRWHLEVRHVGVPYGFAVAEAANRLAVHLDVGNDVNFREPFDETAARFLDRRPVELPQATAEGDQLLITQPLIADQHHRILVPRLNVPHEAGLAKLAEIDAPYFGAERSTGRNDFYRLRGVAFGRRCSSQRHLCLQSAPLFREHST